MRKTESVLDLVNVTKRFTAPDGVSPLVAIERVSFTVRAGEFVAVVGPSGCGKSTILNLVAGLDRPSEGRILLNQVAVLDGREVSENCPSGTRETGRLSRY